MKRQAVLSLVVFLALVGAGTAYRVIASDHDDGENDLKSRYLNLTDHYTFNDPVTANTVDIVQSSNPRSLAGYQYAFSSTAHYDMHVTRVKTNSAVPTGSDDIDFQFTFGPLTSNNVQAVTLTVLHGGVVVGSDSTGFTTSLANGQKALGAGNTINTAKIGGQTYKYFAGLREDTFFFDVTRFFQVRAFLAGLFGGASVTPPVTCDGKVLGGSGGTAPSDGVGLFNPPSCASDFTKNYNV